MAVMGDAAGKRMPESWLVGTFPRRRRGESGLRKLLKRRRSGSCHFASSCRTRRVFFRHLLRASFCKPQSWATKRALAALRVTAPAAARKEMPSWALTLMQNTGVLSQRDDGRARIIDDDTADCLPRSASPLDFERPECSDWGRKQEIVRSPGRLGFRGGEEKERDDEASEKLYKVQPDVGREFDLQPYEDDSLRYQRGLLAMGSEEVEHQPAQRARAQRRDSQSRAEKTVQEKEHEKEDKTTMEDTARSDHRSPSPFVDVHGLIDPSSDDGTRAVAWIKEYMRFPDDYDALQVLLWFVANRVVGYFIPGMIPTKVLFAQSTSDISGLRSSLTYSRFNTTLHECLERLDWEVLLAQYNLKEDLRQQVDEFKYLFTHRMDRGDVEAYYESYRRTAQQGKHRKSNNEPSSLRIVTLIEDIGDVATAAESLTKHLRDADLFRKLSAKQECKVCHQIEDLWDKAYTIEEEMEIASNGCEQLERQVWKTEDTFEGFDSMIERMKEENRRMLKRLEINAGPGR